MTDKIDRISGASAPEPTVDPNAGWTALPVPGNTKNEGFLEAFSDLFNANVVIKKKALDIALKKVNEDASDPEALAKYQAALGEYTLYRNAQSNAVKAYKDVDANTIRNFN